MELKAEDLQRLYGDWIFVIPGDEAESGVNTYQGTETASPLPPAEKAATPSEGASSAHPAPEESTQLSPTGKLIWRPKPASKVLFILHQSELKQKDLTDLLKKIVESIKIPFEAAGFGVITGDINSADFANMPNPFGVVFDSSIRYGDSNPTQANGGDLYFTYKLAELSEDRNKKKELWGQLQEIQAKL